MLATVLVSGCSVEARLNKHYNGKSFALVVADRGAPTTVENLVGGGTLRSYIKKELLRETPINTGQFQYDAFKSPKMVKSEVTEFLVEPSGRVKEVKYRCEFSK